MLGGGAVLLGGADSAPFQAPRPHLPDGAGLHAHALRKGLFFGAAIDTDWLRGDPGSMAHVVTECGMLVSENSFKWLELRPKPDRFTFERPDMLMAFAAHHGLRVRGHTLAWHQSNPDWLTQSITSANAEQMLTSHIHGVVGHFRHRVVQWDVVNEAIAPDDGQPHGFRNTIWYRNLGPAYLDIAFHACAATDPNALRVLNEYGLEGSAPWEDARRGAMLDLLTDLTSRKIPVQALGIQAHLLADDAIDQKRLAQFLDDVVSLGLKLVVTELDVNDQSLPADIAKRDALVAAHARSFLDVILPYKQMLGVVTWGLSDRHNRQDGYQPRADKLPHRPLPLDADLRRKPLWKEMANAFDLAPRRTLAPPAIASEAQGPVQTVP
jgi:endo-1,4-beta-xylanase